MQKPYKDDPENTETWCHPVLCKYRYLHLQLTNISLLFDNGQLPETATRFLSFTVQLAGPILPAQTPLLKLLLSSIVKKIFLSIAIQHILVCGGIKTGCAK